MKPHAIFLLFCCVLFALALNGQESDAERRVNVYLESIREDVPALRRFFYRMPKGGDLHHHFHGSVYAETFLREALRHDFWVHRADLTLQAPGFRPSGKTRRDWARLSDLRREGRLDAYSARLLQQWSNLYYVPGRAELSPHDHFFNAFPSFDAVADSCLGIGLVEIKDRALREKVAYIETMFTMPQHPIAPEARWNEVLRAGIADTTALFQTLNTLFAEITAHPAFRSSVTAHNTFVRKLHETLEIDDDRFTMRYQNYVLRVKLPAQVFADLTIGFASAQEESLIVGVNIVAPEDHPTAMQDYLLHMYFYHFLRQRFPSVKCALHAGELAPGLVAPEELTWHIDAAVHIARADRIGHGVDIPYEPDALLPYMAQRGIPVEINLSSNAFILGIPPQEHPLSLYRRAGVPLVISTDDAGVLRGSLTEEYVLLYRNHTFLYSELKQLAFNAIRYSFIAEPGIRKRILENLNTDFILFEQAVLGD